jgi:hypothetical protein
MTILRVFVYRMLEFQAKEAPTDYLAQLLAVPLKAQQATANCLDLRCATVGK